MEMAAILVSPVSQKGQVTLPKTVRSTLKIKSGSDYVAFRIERNGKVEIVPVEIKEKRVSPYTETEWVKIEKLANRKGKSFRSAEAAKKYLKKL